VAAALGALTRHSALQIRGKGPTTSHCLGLEPPAVLPSSPRSLTVLVVDDQPAARGALAGMLDRLGHRVLEAGDAEWALELAGRHRPDLALLDVVMPVHDGYWLAQQLRAAETGRWMPIIFLSAQDQEQDLWRGIESGGDDYLIKPVSPVVLDAKLRAMNRLQVMQQRLVDLSDQLRAANERLQGLSELDDLTGLINRRGLDRRLHEEIEAARRDQLPLSLLLCDLDAFKRYNDTLGHVEGDRCLQQIGRVLREACHRPRDMAARYGGEEFALILPNTPKSGAMTFSRAVRRMLQTVALPHPASPVASIVTLSGGITTCIPDEGTTAEGLLTRADQALYAAKAQGRDRFFSFEMQLDTVEQRSLLVR
jgi:diguanylate cyclase (GGDEF)-like protein